MSGARGFSLVETLAVVAVIGIAVAIALPALSSSGARARAAAAARAMALNLHALRWQSVSLNTSHGMLFEQDAAGWYWYEVRDGNGNGLRTAEVRGGTDVKLSGPHRIENRHPHITLGFPGGNRVPAIPPRRGWIDAGDPVQFGRSNLISFSPFGTSSSGTLYITDRRRELYGVLLFGPTARIRVWRFSWASGRWRI